MLSAASRDDTSTQPRYTFPWLLLITANVLWAASYVAARFALRDDSVVLMLALHIGISTLILLPLLIASRKALHLTSAADVALLITGESIFTTVLSRIVLREQFRKRTGFALLLGFVGVYLIVKRSPIPNLPAGGGALRIIAICW